MTMLATVLSRTPRGRREIMAWVDDECAALQREPDQGRIYVAGYDLMVALAAGRISARVARKAMRSLLRANREAPRT